MKKTKMVALLGRPLTTVEDTNYDLYLNIATERLEDLTCLNLTEGTSSRIYDVRNGYTTVFTDPFTSIYSVEINGEAFTEYTPMQWDRRNAKWYNSIVLDTHVDTVTIEAKWGICSPELEMLVARVFDLIGKENKGGSNIKSKKVEDFAVTFNDNTAYGQFLLDNELLINKFSLCNIGNIQHGDVRRFGSYYHESYRSRPY